MLEGIDKIDWSQVYGSYGPVPDMPHYIRELVSSDLSQSHAALSYLSDNLIHQGTRWNCTPVAIPFLLDVLEQSATRSKHRIIYLLLSLAVDENVHLLPDGFNPDQEFADVKNIRIEPLDVQTIWRTKDWDLMDARLWDVANSMPRRDHYDSYLAVERGAGLLAQLTADRDLMVRRAALWSLGWFPKVAEQGVHQVRVATVRETDEYMVANSLIVLGLLAKHLNDDTDVPRLEEYLRHTHTRIIRRAAALALVTILGTRIPTMALDVLIAGTEDEENVGRDTDGLGWPQESPSLVGCYWRAIHSLGL